MSTLVEAQVHRKRFSRKAELAPIEITERDHAIVEYVHRYRLLRSTHIATLLGTGNLRVLQRRLAALYDHGFLERPRTQMAYDRFTPGTSPVVYAVGPRARQLLPEAVADPNLQAERINQKNKTLRPIFFEHALMVADVLVAIEAACRDREDVVFVPRDAILAKAPKGTRAAARPLRMQVDAIVEGHRIRLAVEADGLFGLHFLNGRGEGRPSTLYYFLEADRGTERIRTNLRTKRHTNFYQKLTAYFHVGAQKLHAQFLGLDNFRVVTVTTSGKRVDNIITVNKELNNGKGSRLFLFASHDQVCSAPSVLELSWRNGADEKLYRLVD